MKKVRIFFAVALIAIAGAAAAATALKTVTGDLYYYDSTSGYLFWQNSTLPCSTGGSGCKEVINGVSQQVYYFNPDTQIIQPLKRP